MKKSAMGLIAMIVAASVWAEDEVTGKVTVTADRVSLRATPDLNSVLLDRAMNGDELTLKDASNPEWLGVMTPDRVDLWVHSEFLDDGAVIPARLNIRSGPSLNHSVVGVVDRGDVLTIRGEVDGWLRIAPPDTAVVWISREYAEIDGAPAAALPAVSGVIRVQPAPEPEPAVEIVKIVSQPEINELMASASGVAGLPTVLVPDPKKKQGLEIMLSGILRPAGGLLCKLVNPDVKEVVVCYVRGNAAQMKNLEGRSVTILGRSYWAQGLDMPFIRPVKIQLAR